MSRTIQSSNYVPGVSGWKFNESTGAFEINPVRPAQSVEAQMVTVTAGEWSEYDLPANAIERYALIGAELAKIPAEYRDSGEFTTKDLSFDCDGSDVRTTLTYDRPETDEEVAVRLKSAKSAGVRIVRAGGCTTGIVDGVVRWRFGDLIAPVDVEPFKVADGVTYIGEEFVCEASITNLKLHPGFSVKMKSNASGGFYVAGLGLGIPSQLDSSAADKIKEVIRAELRPGGLLHRSR